MGPITEDLSPAERRAAFVQQARREEEARTAPLVGAIRRIVAGTPAATVHQLPDNVVTAPRFPWWLFLLGLGAAALYLAAPSRGARKEW